ncbi:hypothetical protein [Gordonia paraffinivorans]|uniref:hypothetical protein n=1 Tax=Gordonia paraffinivorans TaxID=175628 RepID=UPI0014460209|nr:hypothetical protein [Gordonia paraffinivorans]
MSKNVVAVPVWTIATDDTEVPAVIGEDTLTPERLDNLRTALIALSDVPITTLEAHDVPTSIDRSGGMHLHAVSPLARQLSDLVKTTPKVVPDGSETLYRMKVPNEVMSQVAAGAIKPMQSSAVANGVHSALVDGSKITSQASFVPVSAGKAAAAGASASVLTVAAPLVLMAVAVGASAYADQQRQKTLERITELLERLVAENLETERHSLEACRGAIIKATSVLLDEGRIGASLGLDSTVFAIETALSRAKSRIAKWEKELSTLAEDKVELKQLSKLIPGIEKEASEFYVHLELAQLAIAMKQRVLILQAVEHAQLAQGNPFERFVAALKTEKRDLDALQQQLDSVLLRLSALQLDRSHGIRDVVFASGEVDKLLETTRRLHDLGQAVRLNARQSEVTIDILQEKDGSVVVFPAVAS